MLAQASLIMNLYKKYLGWPMLAMSRGNIGHPSFIKKNGTSNANTMVFGIGIESTIIRTNFYVKKMIKKYV